MTDLILHHYPQSPVSEKVRIVLGMKGLTWQSVLIPRLPPKPELMPLTGGYRLTPVLQIGADIYCDSMCIIRALEENFPEPSLLANEIGSLSWGLSRWTDTTFFQTAIAAVFGAGAKTLPPEFAQDRGLLYFGPSFNLADLENRLAESFVQLRTQFGWVESVLADSRPYLSGERPGLADALVYYLVWFVRGRIEVGPEFLSQFLLLCAWETRVAALGHGKFQEISAMDALAVARDAEPRSVAAIGENEPGAFDLDTEIEVAPLQMQGTPPVAGRLRRLSRDEIVLRRTDGQVGTVDVHFPRVGYGIEAI